MTRFSPALALCLAPLAVAACGDSDLVASDGAADAGDHIDADIDSDPSDSNPVEIDAAAECQPDCAGRDCGDDGCGGSCGLCAAEEPTCVEGACVCQTQCAGKDCGDDGCGGLCGTCSPEQQYCSAAQTCVACETARCGVCDEIDITKIVSYSGGLGQDHGNEPITAEVFADWPITTELNVAFPSGPFTVFTIEHFPGESWSDYTGGEPGQDGAGMVACWDKVGVGIHCQGWDWWTMAKGGNKSFDWPEDRPVAHMLFSVADKKRTAIKYFENWPKNNTKPDYTSATVGTGLVRRSCQ